MVLERAPPIQRLGSPYLRPIWSPMYSVLPRDLSFYWWRSRSGDSRERIEGAVLPNQRTLGKRWKSRAYHIAEGISFFSLQISRPSFLSLELPDRIQKVVLWFDRCVLSSRVASSILFVCGAMASLYPGHFNAVQVLQSRAWSAFRGEKKGQRSVSALPFSSLRLIFLY